MALRPHQVEFLRICDRVRPLLAAGEKHTILANVSPGGGKSALPLILIKELCEPLGYKICWVVPRDSLRAQGEYTSADKKMIKIFGHDGFIRAAKNEANPLRGHAGYVTTYSAIAERPVHHHREMMSSPYVLVLDEHHHVPADPKSPWYKGVAPLVEEAKLVVLMTGTLGRGDEKPIAFVPQDERGKYILRPHGNFHYIEYNRRDALKDGVVVPLRFVVVRGNAKWKYNGQLFESDLAVEGEVGKHALRAALATDYAYRLVDVAYADKLATQGDSPFQSLVVCPRIDEAKKMNRYVRRFHDKSAHVATSDDSKEAHAALRSFRAGNIKTVSTVGMAYEGLDAPMATHLSLLTNIRSRWWLEQCISRVNRTYPGKNEGVVVCPDDEALRDIVVEIARETGAKISVVEEPKGMREAMVERKKSAFVPISSAAAGSIVRPLDNPETIRTAEEDLRKKINSHLGMYCREHKADYKRLNIILSNYFKKSRSEMTIPQLKTVLDYIRERWPLDYVSR